MYVETQKAGLKQFFISLVAAIVISFVSVVIKFFSQSMPVIGDVATVIMYVVFVYYVFAYYSSVFEYCIDSGAITIKRKIGRREKIISFSASQIKTVSKKPPHGVKIFKMCPAIMFYKRPMYINYGTAAVLIDANEGFSNELKKYRNIKFIDK